MRILTLIIIGFLLAACQTDGSLNDELSRASDVESVDENMNVVANAVSTPRIVVTTTDTDSAPKRVTLSSEDFMISIEEPHDWESFKTEYGIVMGEEFSSVAAGGELKGLLVYIFASPLAEYTFATENVTDANMAQTIQMQIVSDPDYIGSARVNTPQSFTWNNYEAAYYLLYDETIDVMTMVMQIVIPESDILLTNTVSAPRGHEHRIHESLPELFRTLKVNGAYLDASALTTLPAFLFPEPIREPNG